MRFLMALVVGLAMTTGAAMAGENGIERKRASGSVAETVDSLVTAMEGAGLKIFNRIDHGAGAVSVGADIGASQLLIFGNPKVGTPALVDDPVAGLFLPLKVLVYEDSAGQAWIAYQKPADMLGPLGGVAEDAPYIAVMTGALGKFTDAVAE